MTTPYVDPQTVHNPTTGGSPPASWGDTVRDNQQLFSTPPSVKAVRTAVQSLANNTTTALAFTAADEWDTDSFHSTVTNNTRVTIPSGLGGKYYLTANVQHGTGGTGGRQIVLRKNGATNINSVVTDSAVGNWFASNTVMVALVPGDYVEVMCFQYTGAALNITGTFSANWVSL
jgi:hypothetical protein